MSTLKRYIRDARALDLRRMAREEFVLMSKAFFAPIYGAVLVIQQLLKQVEDQ